MSSTGSVGSDYYIDTKGINNKSVIMGKDASQLGMEDFFSLLVAQMSNQDMMNPNADTDYIAQMAQFTTLKGIQTIQEYQLSSYASSYAGKTVSIAHVGESGDMIRTEGVVESVTFYDGEPKVIVNNISYPLYSVMEVKTGGTSSSSETEPGSDKAASWTNALSYIGKNVTVRLPDGEDEIEVEGVVTGVNTGEDGAVQIVIDDNVYPASSVTAVTQ